MAGERKTRAKTLSAEFLRICAACDSMRGGQFDKYHDDPAAFCREVLGFEPSPDQLLVLAEIVGYDFITVPAGRAVGKSRLDAALALWFVCTRGAGSRVICTAPTFRQVQVILWEEIRNLFHGAKIKIGGECAKMASTGCRLDSGAQILGLTAEKPEAFQGIRAPKLMIIADEASGIADEIFHVIDGNAAGGAKVLLTGNPTRAVGYFREASRSPRWRVVKLSALNSPNVISGEILVRGLATREWVEERKREWGEDSPFYKIHVLGEFVELEEGRLFSEEMLTGSEQRWLDAHPSGRLDHRR
jgi:phage terminase large subunit